WKCTRREPPMAWANICCATGRVTREPGPLKALNTCRQRCIFGPRAGVFKLSDLASNSNTYGDKVMKRFFKRSLGASPLLAASLLGASALAQDVYPSRALHMIVPFAAGNVTDTIARLIGAE